MTVFETAYLMVKWWLADPAGYDEFRARHPHATSQEFATEAVRRGAVNDEEAARGRELAAAYHAERH